MKTLLASLILVYVLGVPAVGGLLSKQGNEFGRAVFCCTPLTCTEFDIPDPGEPWHTIIGILIVVGILLFLFFAAKSEDAEREREEQIRKDREELERLRRERNEHLPE